MTTLWKDGKRSSICSIHVEPNPVFAAYCDDFADGINRRGGGSADSGDGKEGPQTVVDIRLYGACQRIGSHPTSRIHCNMADIGMSDTCSDGCFLDGGMSMFRNIGG